MKLINFLLAFVLTLFLACDFQVEKDIIPPNQKSQLVVFCDVQAEGGPSVLAIVVRTRNIGETIIYDFQGRDSVVDKFTNKTVFTNLPSFDYPPTFDTIKNATIRFYEADNLVSTLVAPYSNFPQYESPNSVTIKTKTKYQIRVTAPGFDEVFAEQTKPSDVLPTKVTFKEKSLNTKDNGILSELVLTFKDPADEQNAYFVSGNVEITDTKKQKTSYYPVRFIKIDGNTSATFVTNDRLFNGNEFSWRLGTNLNQSFLEDTIGKKINLLIDFKAVSPDLEKFYKSLDVIATASETLFAEPATPFYNIKQGGIGIFSISAKDTTILFKIK
jgi:hypothetical protein